MANNYLNNFSEAERSKIMDGVIEVHGTAMNRTALGIVDALIQIYPMATFSELKTMLPDDLNVSAPKNYKSLFKPYTQRKYGVIQPGSIRQECEKEGLDVNASHFTANSEVFMSSDGIEVLVSKSWESADSETGTRDLTLLIEHVRKYGVVIANYQEKKPFGKGGYDLNIKNHELLKLIHSKSKKSKKSILILSMILLILLISLVLFLISK